MAVANLTTNNLGKIKLEAPAGSCYKRLELVGKMSAVAVVVMAVSIAIIFSSSGDLSQFLAHKGRLVGISIGLGVAGGLLWEKLRPSKKEYDLNDLGDRAELQRAGYGLGGAVLGGVYMLTPPQPRPLTERLIEMVVN